MGIRPTLGPMHQPPKPTPCPDCGYPRYDLEGACSGCGKAEDSDKGHYDHRDAGGKFANVKVVPAPPSTINRLRSAADNLVLAATAYRDHGDPIMKESMHRAHELIADLLIELIQTKEG